MAGPCPETLLPQGRFNLARYRPDTHPDAQRDRIKVPGDSADLRKLRAARALRRKPLNEENQVSVYFDTPKHTLARNDVTLRVRHNGDNRLQTIKSGGLANSFRRGEWEDEIEGDVPNFRKAQDTALAPLLTKKLKRRLKPVFETRIHRTSVPVLRNGSRIEVVVDEGEVRAGRQSAAIGELELELKRGKARDLFKLAREMVQIVPATLALKSKSERGHDLIQNKAAQAVPAEMTVFKTACAPRTLFGPSAGRLCGRFQPTKPQ